MKKGIYITLFIALAGILASCKKSDDKPYIYFSNVGGDAITATTPIPAALNSTVVIHMKAGYERSEGNNLDYEWKIDDGHYKQYSALDGLDITTLGRHNNLRIEEATLDIAFSDEVMDSGSHVSVRVRDQTGLSRTLTFVVE